ncbi:Similar to hypothetical protein [Tuber melanosporum Mel28]; acc. no. XP_002837166 [Pyronema omphalodes CBS 100304]|uniref:DUF7905 domain-containing protein n=1 Tax=Pyronema omphalodes (strain CBS 100304) TaxID=1076935 RepID=U4LPS1_PYROM|nr:Similar to hypothetical protein [Tuber melanosporum Mel28]; acc. no. XP_002837166 [Pyronema omphalodes CBS 100304]
MPSTRQPRKPRRSPSNVTPSSSQAGDHELATPSSSRASPKPSTTSTAIPKAVDYELDTPWGFGEPSKAGEAEPEVEVLSSTPPDIPKPKVRPPPGYGAPPGLRAPPGLVPNRQPNKPYRDPQVAIDRRLQLHSVDLLELGLGAGGFAEPGWLEYPSESEGGITTDIEFISPYADENGDPALVTLHQPVGIQMDNEGDVAERAGLPPNSTFALPARRHQEFDFKFFGHNFKNTHNIARKTGTHISFPTDENIGGRGLEPVLKIWGSPANILRALHDLHALSAQVQDMIDSGVSRVGGWAKVKAMTTDARQKQIDMFFMKQRIRQTYRHTPPDGRTFPAVGIFIWPTAELNPQHHLGKGFEGLDDVRQEQEVYILFNRAKNMFRILGDDREKVSLALTRLKGIFREVATMTRKPTTEVLLKPPSLELEAMRVAVAPARDLQNRQITFQVNEENTGVTAKLDGPRPTRDFMEFWKNRSEIIQKANMIFMRKCLLRGLEDVAYCRSYVRMRVYIGRMVFFSYMRTKAPDGRYGIDDFGEGVRNSRTEGEVIRSIGTTRYNIKDNDIAEQLIKNCNNHILHPKDTNIDNPLEMEPHISATFFLKLTGDDNVKSNIRLEAFMASLGIEEIVDEFHPIGPPPPGMPDQRPKVKRVTFVNTPTLTVSSLVQKTKWRYHMAATRYVFEITRYETLPINEVAANFADMVQVSYKDVKTPFDTRWGAAVYNEDWDVKLSQQSVAPLGLRGAWEPMLEKFFTPSGVGRLDSRQGRDWGDDGFDEFIGRVEEGMAMVRQAQKQCLHRKQAEEEGWPAGVSAQDWAGDEEFDE